METLQQFYKNDRMRDDVRAFLVDHLGKLAVDKSFNGEDTSGIKEAKMALESGFSELKKLYDVPKEANTNNQSR